MKTTNATKLVVSLIAAVLMTACGDSDGGNNNRGTYQGNDYTNTVKATSITGDSIDLDLYSDRGNNYNPNNNTSVPASIKGYLKVTGDSSSTGIAGKACSTNRYSVTGFIPAGTYTITTNTQGTYIPAAGNDYAQNVAVTLKSKSNYNGSRVTLTGTIIAAYFGTTNYNNNNNATYNPTYYTNPYLPTNTTGSSIYNPNLGGANSTVFLRVDGGCDFYLN